MKIFGTPVSPYGRLSSNMMGRSLTGLRGWKYFHHLDRGRCMIPHPPPGRPAPFAETGGVDLRRMSIRVDMDAPYTRLALAFFLPNGDPMYDVEVHVTEFRRQPMTVIVCILVTVIAIGALSLDNRILKLLSLVLPSERRLWIQEEYPTHTFQDINRNVEAVRIVSTHPKTVSEVVEMIPSLDTAGVLHCALCMRQFKGTDRVRFGGTCDYHLFHSTCVYRWIWSNGKRCPSCPPGKYPLRRM
eukprot:GHVO01004508.1.p1 GENE.GHVO01004508.1~~GHVO01004508.1.p1  ORF type:complete len:243 (+),score=54.30 GHVO01004508.1:236-964(+)